MVGLFELGRVGLVLVLEVQVVGEVGGLILVLVRWVLDQRVQHVGSFVVCFVVIRFREGSG